MKKLILILLAAVAVSCASLNPDYLMSGGAKAVQALTLSDAEVQAYVHEYITQLDAQSTVLPESNAYTKRLRKITSGITSVDGMALNFKVYKTSDVNAFACADGSVRVYTGLMDIMDDSEVLGVIGHEIGHVALKHTKKEMKASILTSAALDGISATSTTAAALSQSQLGAIGQSILNAQYSKKQEQAADDYAYSYLKGLGKNPECLARSLEKIQSMESGSQSSAIAKLFSSHPDTAKRIARVRERLVADGYTK
ncbi:MAG: M48 family metallopeptidase [Bacteroidales bacterium]|nr:M48 family metallopeptidase [Bacteroidales bacterium]